MNLLIVEDDITIRQGLKFYLEQENFNVISVEFAGDAIKTINNNHIDLILLDVNLPDMDGFELFKEIKKIKDIPIIFLTANDLEVSVVRGLDMGADDYITKPFKARELVSRIKNVLRRVNNNQDNNLIKIRRK